MESTGGKIALALIAIVLIGVIVAVIIMNPENKEDNKKENKTSNTTTSSNEESSETSNTTKDNNENKNINYMENAKKQVANPKKGETIAIIHVKDFGDITVKFFDDVAPKAVKNFITHAKNGYYDGVKFHRVMDQFMIQGGDPEGTGAGGESIWGKGFEEEISDSLVPYRGSLCMASVGYGKSSLGSQFFITQAKPDNSMISTLQSYGYDNKLIEAYKTYGGYMPLNGQYTVFGQVIDGMNIVDKIAKTKVKESDTGEKSVPVKDIIIKNIEVTTYKK